MSTVVRTPAEFRILAADYARRLDTDPAFREAMELVCGSPGAARAFTNPRGVTLSGFAVLAGVPPTTVRHYLRVGLITPYEVNGKYRFMAQHLAQAASVRQWRELGLSLEDILSLHQAERLGGQTVVTAGELTVVLRPARAGDHAGAHGLDDEVRGQLRRALVEVRAARERLEARAADLQARLARARQLEAALEHVSLDLPGRPGEPGERGGHLGRVLAAPVPDL
ncbi:MerR family transcriptional regulator [Deinococcus pimensis]|uniref:MerR family transcriptional regulator n=1 Tax=Deinococcus pimensis TaxID=309888 RepID=UPI0012F7A0CB|nr:MerR family transcriptional regulator [Deinococcus pimensis]